jgi:hypothetical protein
MAYDNNIKMRAYSLYLQGLSYEDIARDIKSSFGVNIATGTVRNWAEKPDGSKSTWGDYRAKIRIEVRKNIDISEKDRVEKIRERASAIQEKLFDQIIDESAPGVNSMEGAVYAFKTISEFVIKLDEKNRDTNPLAIVQTMLEIFWDIPEVRTSIQKNWQRVETGIKSRIMGYKQLGLKNAGVRS